MKLTGIIDDKKYEITVEADIEGSYYVTLNGITHRVDARTISPDSMSLIIDNKNYDIDVEYKNHDDPLDSRISVRVFGQVIDLEMLDERRKKLRDAQNNQAIHGGSARITSPMPGRILRVLVKPGDVVEEGQGLIVIEAMKMENELTSPKKATVKEIVVEPGRSVDGGALLIVLD